MPYKWLFIMIAGGLGALVRWKLSNWEAWKINEHFPWSLLFVNLIGCFFFGFFYAAINETRFANPDDVKLVLLTGFMGALTTYSTFAFESMEMLYGNWVMGVANIVSHVVFGLLCVFVGMRLGMLC